MNKKFDKEFIDIKMKKIFWCKNCLNMSTRPRIEFDKKVGVMLVIGLMKKKINWKKKLQEFKS